MTTNPASVAVVSVPATPSPPPITVPTSVGVALRKIKRRRSLGKKKKRKGKKSKSRSRSRTRSRPSYVSHAIHAVQPYPQMQDYVGYLYDPADHVYFKRAYDKFNDAERQIGRQLVKDLLAAVLVQFSDLAINFVHTNDHAQKLEHGLREFGDRFSSDEREKALRELEALHVGLQEMRTNRAALHRLKDALQVLENQLAPFENTVY